jgi:hypothetical protein
MLCSLKLPEREREVNVRRSNGEHELGYLKGLDTTRKCLKEIK